jgi:LysM repeat protein/soluble lytic murein transglycosylase-like protein
MMVVAAVGLLVCGCAHGGGSARNAKARASRPDTTATLIAKADAHLDAGVAEIRQGHLNRARQQFDAALAVYLGAPGGALQTPAMAEAYRRTLRTIQLHELEALAAGDGYAEPASEDAAIDAVADLPLDELQPGDDTRRVAEDALRGESNDLDITLNDAVLACIDLYQGELREWFGAALARGGRYLPKIRDVFAAHGIPQDLAYVALVESAFKTGALSRAKAKGVWQFIPSTGRRFGLQQDWWVDERSDPDKSTLAAAQYLKELHELFGDWNLALAGYNAGEGKVQRAIDSYGTADFWELARTPAFRAETRNYVPMIQAAIVVAKAPEKYGFDVDAEPLIEADSVRVADAVDLRVVAECAGSSLDRLRLLNPALRRLATPAHRSFDVRVPTGTAAATHECLRAIPAERRVAFRAHTVARGQTLASIARQHGTRATDIAQANGLSPRARLARGQELIIPVSARPAAKEARVAEARPRPSPPPAPSAPPATEETDSGDGKVRISYKVKSGDTLSAIARAFKTTIRALQSWNGLSGSRIAAGHTLTIYTQQ